MRTNWGWAIDHQLSNHTPDTLRYLRTHMGTTDHKCVQSVSEGRTTGQEIDEWTPIIIIIHGLQQDVFQKREGHHIPNRVWARKCCVQHYPVECECPHVRKLSGCILHVDGSVEYPEVENLFPWNVGDEIKDRPL